MSDYNKILEEIFNSIHVITDKKIEQLQLDKTIIAPIVKNINATNNQYTISYQGAEYEVYSIKGDTYSVGENVMVLIPKNNFSNKKLILMRADKAAETAVAAGAISPETQAQIDDAIQKVEDLIIETNNLSVTKSGIFYDPDSAAKEPFATRDGDTWFVSDQGYKIKIARAITGVTGITSTGSSNVITILTSNTSQISIGSYIILRGTSDAVNVDGVWAVTGISANTSFTVQTTNNTTQTNLYVSEFSTFVLKWQDAALGAEAIDTSSINLDGTTIFYADFANKPLPTTDGDTWFVQDQDKKVKIAKSIKSITDITANDPNPLLIRVNTTDLANLSIGESIYLSGFTLDGFSGERQVYSIGADYFTFLNTVDPIGTIYNGNVQILYWDDMPLGAQAIADDSITAVKIQAGSITADRIVVGNPANLADNASFELQVINSGYELDTPGWDFPSPISTVSIYNDPSRSKCLQINGNGTTLTTIASKFIAVQPNHAYFIHGHYKANSNSSTGSVAIGFRVYAKDQSTVIATYSVSSLETGTSTQWTSFKQADTNGLSQNISTFNIPSNGYYIKPIITVANTALSGSIWYVDDIFVGKSAETSFIADAAITNAKIGSLSAGKITTGTLLIDGTTGANANISIQTSGSERLRLDSTGLYGKNSAGTETFKLDTLGNLTLGVGSNKITINGTDGSINVPYADAANVATSSLSVSGTITVGGESATSAIIGKNSSQVETFKLDTNGNFYLGTVASGQLKYENGTLTLPNVSADKIYGGLLSTNNGSWNTTGTSGSWIELYKDQMRVKAIENSTTLEKIRFGIDLFNGTYYPVLKMGASDNSALFLRKELTSAAIAYTLTNSSEIRIEMNNSGSIYMYANSFTLNDNTSILGSLTVGTPSTNKNTTINGNLTVTGTINGGAAGSVDLTAVTTNINPNATETLSIGTSALRWNSIYATNLNLSNNFAVGNTVNSNLIPGATTYNLGTSANKWNNIYGNNFYGNGSGLTGVVAVFG